MSNREFNAQRTMLANAFATAGAELLDYMGTAAALAAIPNTDPPRYVVAGTLAMIAKVLPSADAPAAATVLTDEVRAAMKRAYSLGQTYWQQADSEYTSQHKKADVTAGRFIELTDEICSKVAVLAKAAAIEAPNDPKQLAKWWSLRGSVITAAINQEPARFPVEDLSELLNVFDAALPDESNGSSDLAHAGVTAEPADYVLLPRVMTAAMINAWSGGVTVTSDNVAARTTFQKAWKRVIEAAPTIPAQVPAAEVRTAEDEQEECWSADQENFNAMSLGELIDCNDELAPGMTVWVADAVRPSPKHLIDADDVIELMGERAFDIARENAEDYPDVSDAEKAELDAILKSWIDRACPPNFWRVNNVRPYILSADDFPDDATPIEASFAAPSTADSANTGALGEKGADRG